MSLIYLGSFCPISRWSSSLDSQELTLVVNIYLHLPTEEQGLKKSTPDSKIRTSDRDRSEIAFLLFCRQRDALKCILSLFLTKFRLLGTLSYKEKQNTELLSSVLSQPMRSLLWILFFLTYSYHNVLC